ncbi:hypothetical protein O181_089315 [Austropuccinia psidii MF-1]|uniref:Uncharacterized protein n=1 Tax=Austropuccinia psidii MF-1 TaxID=1389203 RepID=A0A9Q3IT15_9BASI|nr:hypothetical protein [Austropuccinia psidii MF-1]
MLKVYLVWVLWSYLKLFLDWIAWAIPFYDEFHFLFLVWLIVFGPWAADVVFRHAVKRVAAPYEHSFDLILGTTHDTLQVIMFLITSGPKYLNLKWQKWKAWQFNKSLFAARSNAPPTRLPSLNRNLSQLHSRASSINIHPDLRVQAESQTINSSSQSSSHITRSINSTMPIPSSFNSLIVPRRKPTLSRKLSASYKRSVSNSRPKAFLEDRELYFGQTMPSNRLGLSQRTLRLPPFQSTSHFNFSNQTNSSQIENAAQSNQTNQTNQTTDHIPNPSLGSNQSIIIHDQRSSSIHETSLNLQVNPSTQLNTMNRKRTRNPDDDEIIKPERKAKKITRADDSLPNSSKPAAKSRSINQTKTKTKPIKQKPRSTESSRDSENEFDSKSSISISSLPSLEFLPGGVQIKKSKEKSTWRLSSNAALPLPDQAFSPSQVPAPKVRRRLHNPDEPLPLPMILDPKDETSRDARKSSKALKTISEVLSAQQSVRPLPSRVLSSSSQASKSRDVNRGVSLLSSKTIAKMQKVTKDKISGDHHHEHLTKKKGLNSKTRTSGRVGLVKKQEIIKSENIGLGSGSETLIKKEH